MNLHNKEGIWRLCQDVVSSLSYAQWSVSGKGIHRCRIQNVISAGAKNRRKGEGKTRWQGRKGQRKVKNQKTRGALLMNWGGRKRKTDDNVGALWCAGVPSGCRQRCFNISPWKVKTLGSTSENESMQTGEHFSPLAAQTGQMRSFK